MARLRAGATSSSPTTSILNVQQSAPSILSLQAPRSAFSRNCSRDGVYRQKSSPTSPSSSCRAKLKVCKLLGIEHARTALYHHQANGEVERFNRFLTDQLRLERVENKPVDNALFIALSCTSRLGTALHKYLRQNLCAVAEWPCLSTDFESWRRQKPSAFSLTTTFAVLNDATSATTTFASMPRPSTSRMVNTSTLATTSARTSTSRCGHSCELLQRINDSTVRLDNVTVRNAADLVLARPPTPELQPPFHQPPKAEKQPFVPAPADEQPVLRRSERERRPPAWHTDYSILKPKN